MALAGYHHVYSRAFNSESTILNALPRVNKAYEKYVIYEMCMEPLKNGEVVFLHKVLGMVLLDKSYGIHVGLAGLPTESLENASTILNHLEAKGCK